MFVIFFAIGVFALSGLITTSLAAKSDKPPVGVRVATVETIDFHDRVEALGTLTANESVVITATVTDTISAIQFEDGQRVVKDQVLIEMSAAEERAQLAEVESTLAEAQLQYERTKGLAKKKLISASSLDERRRDVETAKARIRAMKARLADRSIRSPFTGVLGLRNISVGALVAPGTRIVELSDDSRMKLDFSVPSTLLGSLKPGADIVARSRGLDGAVFRGKISSIDNRVDTVTRTIRVRAILPNENQKLVPGLLMQIELVNNARQAKVVPEEAIIPIGSDRFVFVVGDGNVVQRRKVQTGARRIGQIEILSGLRNGEVVITHGTLKVREGAKVKIDQRAFKRITPTPFRNSRKEKKPSGVKETVRSDRAAGGAGPL